MHRRLSAVLIFAWLAVTALAADKSGVGLSKISLPSGPGSIEGLGDSFEPQLNSGTSSYSVKVAIPPGVNGLQPEVVLRYNAGSGNGPFGLAWSLGGFSIQRQTEKGLPTYTSSDVFTFQGEELVALSDGSYRCENESGFMRFTRSGDGWQIQDKAGKTYKLGSYPNLTSPGSRSRVTKPTGNTFNDTFKWCVDEVTDTHGNRMQYLYTTNTDSPGQIYLSEIRYSIFGSDYHSVVFDYQTRADSFSSFLSGFEMRMARRCNQIRVLSRGNLVRRYVLSYDPEPGDPIEPISVNDAGLLFSLIRKVTQFDNRTGIQSSYLPPLRFAYTRFDASAGTNGVVLNNPPYSLGNPNIAFADINCDSLPDLLYTDPLTGGHSVYYNLGEGIFAAPVAFTSFPAFYTLDNAANQLTDYDGDGKVDFVHKSGDNFGQFAFFPNTTKPVGNNDAQPTWGAQKDFDAPFPPFTLDDPSVRTLDLNGDKRIDFIRTTPYGFIYYYNRGTWWQEDGIYLFGEPQMGDITEADALTFSVTGAGGAEVPNDQVKLADMNGDRLLDLVRVNLFGTLLEVTFWPNKGNGYWGSRRTIAGTIDLGVIPLEDVFITDVNADGLADVVAVGANFIKYWINTGNGSFSREFLRTGMPDYIHGTTVLRQVDINGNGSTDFLWENFDPSTGSFKIEYYDFLATSKPNLLRAIDNGIGLRTDIEYKTTTDFYIADRKTNAPWNTRLPFSSQVVSRITKRFGLDLDPVPGQDQYVTDFSYHDGYYDSFEKEFRGFAFAKKVDLGDDRYTGTNAITVHSPTTITRFAFHTGTPDGVDNNEDGTVDEVNSRSGYEEESIKGKVLWTETTLWTADAGGPYPRQTNGVPAQDSVVFTREYNTWKIRTIHSPTSGFTYRDAFGVVQPAVSIAANTTDGKRVSFPFVAAHVKEIHEANGTLSAADSLEPVRTKKILYTEKDVDFFGNTIAERNYGEYSPGSTYDDERFTYSTYAFNLSAWLIGLPARKFVTDENGNFVSDTRNYYDGAAFTGLPLGEVGLLGDMTREEHSINGPAPIPAFSIIINLVGDPRLAANATITATRSRYDNYGNVLEVRDPLYTNAASGHAREFAYDATFHTYVEQETIHVGNSKPDLVASAIYDFGAGVITGSTDFNGNSSTYQYDSFWRLVGIVKPGDTLALPTQTFTYRPGDIFRSLYYNYAPNGDLTLAPSTDTVVSSVSTRAREQAGTTNTFDTYAFTDGAGHKLGVASESEVSGQWVFKDVKRYTSRGHERDAYLPFLSSTNAYVSPPVNLGKVEKFYDAAARVTRTLNPPETTNINARITQTRTVYLPLETVLYDEEDLEPTSPHYLTPHVQFKDGLDRLVGVDEVVKLNDDGTTNLTTVAWPTRYRYDLNDKLTHITDSHGNQKWFRYDGLGRKLFMNDPDRGTMTYTYDDASNLAETTDAKTQVIRYTYDGVNRLLSEDYLDEPFLSITAGFTYNPAQPISTNNRPDVAYFYDAPVSGLDVGNGTTATAQNTKGFLAYVWDLTGEEHTSYDARGRVSYTVKRINDPIHGQPVSFRTGFAYDSLDRVTQLTYPDDDFVFYQYNSRNLLERIHGGQVVGALGTSNVIAGIDYLPSDQLAQIDYGNNTRTTYSYDPRLRLNSLLTVSQPATLNTKLISFAYDFDGVSNIRQITDGRPATVVAAGDKRRNTQVFDYDNLYRLTRVQYSFETPGQSLRNDGSVNYRYDRIGNMLAQTSDLTHIENGLSVIDLGAMGYGGASGKANRSGRQPADPPGPHALTSVTSGGRAYPYDGNGNMTVIDGITNTWDFKDRLLRVESTNMVAFYAYDYTDRRITKRVIPKSLSTPNSNSPSTTLYIDKYSEVRPGEVATKYIWNGETRVTRLTAQLSPGNRVQRLRYRPGSNLLAPGVSAGSSPWATMFASAQRWNAGGGNWVAHGSGDALAAETVLWLRSGGNGTLTLSGTPWSAGARVVNGTAFVAGWGAEVMPLGTNLLPTLDAWAWDEAAQAWRKRFGGSLGGASDLPATLDAGRGLFARTVSSTPVAAPDPTLTVRFYHQDHLGSSSVLTDAAGNLVEETANYAFGHPRNQHQIRGSAESYRFTQKELDSETSLQCLEARFFSGILGRFTRVDPLSSPYPAAMNSYAYGLNNPLRFVDPSGDAASDVANLLDEKLHSVGESIKIGDTSEASFFNDVIVNSVRDVAKLFTDTLRFGEGIAEAKNSLEQGEFKQGGLALLQDIGRGASIAGTTGKGVTAYFGRAAKLGELPSVAYHLTEAKNVESIFEMGLRPTEGVYKNLTDFGRKNVYMFGTENPSGAQRLLNFGKEQAKQEVKILIDVTKLDPSKLTVRPLDSVIRYRGPIPADAVLGAIKAK